MVCFSPASVTLEVGPREWRQTASENLAVHGHSIASRVHYSESVYPLGASKDLLDVVRGRRSALQLSDGKEAPLFRGVCRPYVENEDMSMESRQGSSGRAQRVPHYARHKYTAQTCVHVSIHIGRRRRADIQGSVDTLDHNTHSDLTIG